MDKKTSTTGWVAAVAALLLAVSGLVAGAAPANAYSFERDNVTKNRWTNGSYWCLENPWDNAVGCLEVRGDYLQPGDLDGDGRRVGIHWETDYGRRGLCQNATGVDASLDGPVFHAYGQHQCNKNWKENHKIRFRVGTCNGSKVNCTYLKNWGQWSGWSRWYLND
jgi:hypothetical protein